MDFCKKGTHERARLSAGFRFIYSFLVLTGLSVKRRWIEAVVLILFLLGTQAFYEYAAYNIGLMSSEFYAALTTKCYDRFMWTIRFSILYVVGISLMLGVTNLVSGHLAVFLRTAISERLQSFYFKNKNFYTVNNLMEIDNADQRLTQDIGTACTLVSEILPLFLINPILVIVYSYKCVERAGWLGPVSSYILFVVYAIITHFVTVWSSKAIYEHDRQEGNFRFFHTQVRTTSEGAAFLDIGEIERYFASTALWRMLHAYRVSANRKPVLYFLTQLSSYTGSVLNYMAIGVALFGGFFGDPDASTVATLISQNSFYLLYLISKLTTLVDLATKIAQLVGVGHRVVMLGENLSDSKNFVSPAAYIAKQQFVYDWVELTTVRPDLNNLRTADVAMQVNEVTVALPVDQSRRLIENLNLTVCLNRPLLISGPSGVGKTALLRVLANLWPAIGRSQTDDKRHSCFYRSPQISILFVPQRPFFPSAFACPYELFTVLDDDFDRELVEQTLTSGSDAAFRGLHLTYLLLTVAQLPYDPNTKYGMMEPNPQEMPRKDLSGYLMDADDVVAAEGDRIFCGYRLSDYMKALNLLVEFRLLNFSTRNYISDRLKTLSYDDKYNSNSKSCLRSSWLGFKDIFRMGCRTIVKKYDFAGGEWRSVYSPGEMQRVILAAVCYRQPHIVFLDESTSQLNESAEHQAYESLKARNITPVSVGHRMSLRVHHVEELRVTPRSVPADLSDLPPHRVIATGPNWYHITYTADKKKL